MDFTPEEREYIDKILAEVEEEQKMNGNKLIPFDEFAKEFLASFDKEEKDYNI